VRPKGGEDHPGLDHLRLEREADPDARADEVHHPAADDRLRGGVEGQQDQQDHQAV